MVIYILIGIVLFSNIALNYLSFIPFLQYWDESMFALLIIIYIKHLVSKKRIKKDSFLLISLLICITVIGLIGNYIYNYQSSLSAVFRDIVGFLKFPLSLIIFLEIGDEKRIYDKLRKISPFLKIVITVIFVFGILSLFADIGMSQNEIRHGIRPYMFLFNHPTSLVSFMVWVTCLLNALKEDSVPIDILSSITIILAMRTKGFVFLAVYLFIKYFSKMITRYKVIYWFIILIIVYVISYQKMGELQSFSTSGRQVFYLGSIRLFKSCFPIGSGFATFASSVSGEYFSRVYNFIHSSEFYVNNVFGSAVLGDTGYPYYVGQFGFLGLIVLIYITFLLVRLSYRGVHKKNKIALTSMWLYIAITLTTESCLLNNGFEIALIIAIVSLIGRINVDKGSEIKNK